MMFWCWWYACFSHVCVLFVVSYVGSHIVNDHFCVCSCFFKFVLGGGGEGRCGGLIFRTFIHFLGWAIVIGKGRHLYMYSSILFTVVVGVVVLVAVVRWYVRSKETEMRNVYMMVDRILGMYIIIRVHLYHLGLVCMQMTCCSDVHYQILCAAC
jgi:hypothetical protein